MVQAGVEPATLALQCNSALIIDESISTTLYQLSYWTKGFLSIHSYNKLFKSSFSSHIMKSGIRVVMNHMITYYTLYAIVYSW